MMMIILREEEKEKEEKKPPCFFPLHRQNGENASRRLMTGSLVLKKNNAEEKEDLEETRTSWNALRLRRVRVPTSALFDAAPDESFEEEEGENNICLSAADEGGLVSGCAIKIDARNGVILDVWRESDDGNDDACYGGEKEKEEDELVVDCENCLLVPCFLDAHTHLIKTHTVERCRNPTGSIPDALGCELADQPRWMDVQDERTMKTDFERRFDFAVRSALYYGAIGIRTHLDGTNNLENKILRDKVFEVFSRKRNELLETRGVYLQGVCNLFLPLWSEPGIADEFAKVAAANNDNEGGDSVLLGAYCGVVGRGETNNNQARKHFRNLFSYANKYAMNIDVHIDETNDPNCCAVLSCLEACLNDDDGNLSAFKNIRSLSLSTACFFYSCENACNLSRKSTRMHEFDVLAPSDREWSRQRDESLIDILTEFCPCLVFYPLYKEREKNVKESAKHQKLSFKQQEHEG